MRIGDLLRGAMDASGLSGAWLEGRVRGAWRAVAGEHLAAHAWVLRLRKGTLEIGVSDDAWATQVRYLGGDIARRLNDALGETVVREVLSRRARKGAE